MADNERGEYDDDALYMLAYLALKPIGSKIGDEAMEGFKKWWESKSSHDLKTSSSRPSKKGMKGGKEVMMRKLADQVSNQTRVGVSVQLLHVTRRY